MLDGPIYCGKCQEENDVGTVSGRGTSSPPIGSRRLLHLMDQTILYHHLILMQNPGFDFSGAEFNGAVPDPETFMGGVKL